MYITNGAHIINSHGWIVTRRIWLTIEGPIEVRLEESDCKTEENEKS